MSVASHIPALLLDNLVCPHDKQSLRQEGSYLISKSGRAYPVIDGIPVLFPDICTETMNETIYMSRKAASAVLAGAQQKIWCIETLGINNSEKAEIAALINSGTSPIDPVVSYMVAATSGYAYQHLKGRLTEYPIPELRIRPDFGPLFLDIGCNWGRWSIAAARNGFLPIGIDPQLGSVLAAKRVAKELCVEAWFICADARFLPFRDGFFHQVYSYSVLQHLNREDVRSVLCEAARTLKHGGKCFVQMPTPWGVRPLYHQVRRGFREAKEFEVRYWSLANLNKLFTESIGRTHISVDCFFGIGLQASDYRFMRWHMKFAIILSEYLRKLSNHMRILRYIADSVYVDSTKA
jgi:SAM-dependent methyltransferase/uncharacterized protein YbaR (Trm112 family)